MELSKTLKKAKLTFKTKAQVKEENKKRNTPSEVELLKEQIASLEKRVHLLESKK